jgi:hypothetical protein
MRNTQPHQRASHGADCNEYYRLRNYGARSREKQMGKILMHRLPGRRQTYSRQNAAQRGRTCVGDKYILLMIFTSHVSMQKEELCDHET